MKEKIGILLICLGLMMADSDNMLIPIAIVAAGGWLAKSMFQTK